MMEFLKGLFGFGAAEPSEVPGADGAMGVACIEVALLADRSRAGTLRAVAANGDTLAGPWPVMAKADPALAAKRGNPDCDWRKACGETPTGAYEVVGRLSDKPASLGQHDALVLRALAGPAATAEASGRALLMIHGGRPGAATDGSLRLPDEAMDELLSLLPPDPATAAPRIRVVIEEVRGAGNVSDQWDWDPATNDDYDDLIDFLARIYLWETFSTDTDHPGPSPDDAAIEELRDLGYGTLQDGDVAPPSSNSEATPVGESCAKETDGTDQPVTCADTWSPTAGAYDR
jgi:hypothetical protein